MLLLEMQTYKLRQYCWKCKHSYKLARIYLYWYVMLGVKSKAKLYKHNPEVGKNHKWL